jgi:tagatose 6-phosphate kinase
VVASLGPDGLLAVTDAESWQVVPPEVVLGNPTGAGDATMAALAAGLVGGHPWSETLREAVAVSAAAVLLPVAGGFDPTAYRRFRDAVTVRPLRS